jgi:hypothetical protein
MLRAMRAALLMLACTIGGCTFHVEGLGSLDRRDLGALLIDGGQTQPLDLARPPPDQAPDLAQPSPLVDMASPPDLAGSFLHVTANTTPAMVDLSKEGTFDWAHWGFGTASDFDRKQGGNNLIALQSLIHTINAVQYGDGVIGYK